MNDIQSKWISAALAIGGLLLACVSASAQEVRERGSSFGYGTKIRRIDDEAEKQGRTDWPRVVDGESGTQVHISFNARNADVTFLISKDTSLNELLAEARRIAAEMQLPRADFIRYEGLRTLWLDIEMNKYLVKTGRRTEFDLNLGDLAEAIRRSHVLPKPIVFEIEPRESDEALLTSDSAPPARLKGVAVFMALKDVRPGLRLHYVVEIPVASYVAAVAIGLLFVWGMLSMVRVPWLTPATETRRPMQYKQRHHLKKSRRATRSKRRCWSLWPACRCLSSWLRWCSAIWSTCCSA